MSKNYFSIKGDLEIISNNGFFCHACGVSKPAGEQSPDPRYCRGCYDLLLNEAKMLGGTKHPEWVPKPQNRQEADEKQYHIVQPINKEKTKMSPINSVTVKVDNFRLGGRPKTYKKRQLPVSKIKLLHQDGMGAKAIAAKLKKEQGIVVSYKTIQRVLSGERTG